MSKFTAEQKMTAAEREVTQRKKVYRRLVHTDRMSHEKADYEIAVMQEIAEDYRNLLVFADQPAACCNRGADRN